MLFLADEDFPGIAVRWLRQAGHDVLWARTDLPGKADAVLLATAQAESRVILTCDKDFGDSPFMQGCRPPVGSCSFDFSGTRRSWCWSASKP